MKSPDNIAHVATKISARLQQWFGIDQEEEFFKVLNLGQVAQEMKNEISGNLINVHPLRNIVIAALNSVVDHSNAIDSLRSNQTALLHVRHIEELFTVTKFLISRSSQYDEFLWRWDNFQKIHGLRNQLLNLKNPMDPTIQQWIDTNVENVASYHNKKVTNNIDESKDQWLKISNWLYPINLKDIFKETDRQASYASAEYDWNSQVVHFSPMGSVVANLSLQFHDYHDFAVQSTLRYIVGFCRETLPLVVNVKSQRRFHAKLSLLDIYRVTALHPDYYESLLSKDLPQIKQVIKIVLDPSATIDQLINSLIGEAPKDPLAIDQLIAKS